MEIAVLKQVGAILQSSRQLDAELVRPDAEEMGVHFDDTRLGPVDNRVEIDDGAVNAIVVDRRRRNGRIQLLTWLCRSVPRSTWTTPRFSKWQGILFARLASIEPDFGSLIVQRLAAVPETVRRS
ncbi:MAG: hypothetical protein JNK92_12755 [Dechloromonas sp.]|nr:hypothetical protein [Dechloromonas sp.]